MFYCEQLTATGNWAPVTWSDRPTSKSASGRRIQIRNVQELTDEQSKLSLKALELLFNPDSFKREYFSILINWCDTDVGEGNFSWAGWADSMSDAEAQARAAMWETVEHDDDEEPPEYGSVADFATGFNMWQGYRVLELSNLDPRVMNILRPPEVL